MKNVKPILKTCPTGHDSNTIIINVRHPTGRLVWRKRALYKYRNAQPFLMKFQNSRSTGIHVQYYTIAVEVYIPKNYDYSDYYFDRWQYNGGLQLVMLSN